MLQEKEDYYLDFSRMISYSNKDKMKALCEKHKEVYIDLIKLTNDCLKESGVTYMVEQGTLLGAFRNGKIIPHDHDIDFAIIGSEEQQFERVAEVFKNRVKLPYIYYTKDNGNSKQHKIVHQDLRLDSLLGCEEDKDLYLASVDIYLFEENKEENCYQHLTWSKAAGFATISQQKSLIFPLKTIEIEGITVPCPNLIKEHLESIYNYLGEDCYYDYEEHIYKKLPENKILNKI